VRHILFAALFYFSVACTNAATSIPSALVGIWETEGSEFRGETLTKGQALYLDTDGIGASVGGDGRAVMGVRIVVISYNPSTNVLTLDLTENGRVVASGSMTYDPSNKLILDSNSKQRYERHSDSLSVEVRRSLGLELKTK